MHRDRSPAGLPRLNSAHGLLLLFLVAGIPSTALGVFSAWRALTEDRLFDTDGQVARGTIISRTTMGTTNKTYWVTFSYDLQNAPSQKKTAQIDRDTWDKSTVNASILVSYLQSDPSHVRVEGQIQSLGLPVALIIIGGSFLIGATIVFAQLLRTRRLTRREAL